MIQIVVGIVLILLHIICCILVWVGICTHIINVKKYLMFPVVFVPVWGVLCVFILHFQIWIQSDQRKEVGVEKMKVNEEIYKNIFQSGTEQEGNIVPLECKSADNVRAKSLKTFISLYEPAYSVRVSAKNFGFENGIKSVPLYAVFCLKG